MSDKTLLAADAFETASNDSRDPLLPMHSTATESRSPRRSHHRLTISALFCSIALNLLLSYRLATLELSHGSQNQNLFWTPFNSRLQYHVRRFTSGFGQQVSQWQGIPSPRKDESWKGLYVESFTLPKAEAQKLANKTVPVTEDPESEYLTSFSVFHYLHCLDMMRKVTEHIHFPEYYNMSKTHNLFTDLEKIPGFEEHGMYSYKHMDHCMDSLRQALTCKPDLGPVVWQWNRKDKRVEVFAETVHTCANWDEVLEYAREREYEGDFVADNELEPVGQCGFYDEDCGFKS